MLRQTVSPLRSALIARRQMNRQQLRGNSTLTKITEKASAAVATSKSLVDSGIYWGKVVSEVSKEVYIKESFSPPQIKEVVSTFQGLYSKLIPTFSSPEAFVAFAKSINGVTLFKFTGYTLQVVGAFSLGEIIGRRKIVGY